MITLSANTYQGLVASTDEEQELINNFAKYCNNTLIQEASSRNAVFNATNLNLSYRPTIILYIWNKIYEQLEVKRQFAITGRTLNYSTPYPGASTNNCKRTLGWNNEECDATPPYGIRITYITRGMVFFDELSTHMSEETRLKRMETILTKDRYHKCRIYKDSANIIHYVTNRWENNDIFKLVGMLPLFYDDLLTDADATTANAKEIIDLCSALYNNGTPQADLSALIASITEITKNMDDLEKERILNAFNTNMTRISSSNLMELKRELLNKKQSIENTYAELFQKEQYRHALELQIFAAELCPTTIDPAVIEFLKRTQAIKLLDCDDTYCVWEVFTPITNYNRADVEMFFKRTEHNVFNNPDWLGKLIIATFIEEKYQLMTDTKIGMHWSDFGNWRKYQDAENRFGNPHITNFNCFSATKQAVHKAMRDGQMLSAINMIIAAAATITFTDGAVTERLAQALKGYAKTYKIFKDVATGELISAADFIEIITAKEAAKTAAVESVTIDPAATTTYPPNPF